MKTPYSSGIYSRLGTERKDDYGFLAFIPGLPHLQKNKQVLKGWLLLIGSVFALISLFSLFIPQLSGIVSKILALIGNQNADEIAKLFDFTFWFRFVYGSLLLSLIIYLINENKKDLIKDFHNIEIDKKASVLAASMSSSYLLAICFFIAVFIYGLAHFVPLQKEQSIEIEMLLPFVDNPPQVKEPPKPPKEAKNSALQNAVNSGRHDKKLPLSPGNQQPKPQVGRNTPSQPTKSPSPAQPKTTNTPPQPKAFPSPFPSPVSVPQPKANNSSSQNKPLLPSFKPLKGDERTLLSSNESSNSPAPIKPMGNGGYASHGSYSSPTGGGGGSRGPVLPSRAGGFSQGAGLGNAGANNNPNGPITVAARKDVDYGAFMQDLQRRIQNAWKPSSADKADTVQLSFSLRSDGSLIVNSITTVKTSNPEAEAAARQAVIAASPGFRPLPAGSPAQVRIDFTFTRTGTRFMGLKKY